MVYLIRPNAVLLKEGVFFYSILLWNITVFKIDILINGLR